MVVGMGCVLLDEFCDAAAGAGEEDGLSFFGDPAYVKAGSGEKLPVHSIVMRHIYT